MKGRENSPGPGAYTPTHQYVKKNGETWSLGQEKQRPASNVEGPGPGDYDPSIDPLALAAPTYRIGTAPRFDFKIKKAKNQIPGPSNYNPNSTLTKQKSESWVFGTQ